MRNFPIRKLYEVNRDKLLRASSPDVHKEPIQSRAYGYSILLDSIIVNSTPGKEELTLEFKTSKFGHSTNYTYISLISFWPVYEEKGDLHEALVYAIEDGDIEVYCDCPSWVYSGYKFIATRNHYAYKSMETRPPKKNNPHLTGALCKHAYLCLERLPRYMNQIESYLASRI